LSLGEQGVTNQWYCGVEGQQYGPYSWEQMRTMATEGRVIAETYVRRETDQQWLTAAQIPGLLVKKPSAPVTKSRTVISKTSPSNKTSSTRVATPVAKAVVPPEPTAPPLPEPPAPPTATIAAAAEPAPTAGGLPFNIQVPEQPLSKGSARSNGTATVKTAARPAVAATKNLAQPALKPSPAQAKKQQALIVGGLLAGGLVLLAGLAGGIYAIKNMPKQPEAKQAASKTPEQLLQDQKAAELAKLEEAKRMAAVDAQLRALDEAEGRTPAASFSAQPATPDPAVAAKNEAGTTPPVGKAANSAGTAALPTAATPQAAAPPAVSKASPAEVAAATQVLGTIKQWFDVSRAPRIGLRKMQLQVSSAWLASDATGKRVEPPEPQAEGAEAPAEAAKSAAPPAARFVFVEVRITNGDTTPRSYASWNSLGGTNAILADATGQVLEFVPLSATPGVTRLNLVQLASGQSVNDTLVFAAPQGPPGKLKLALASTALLGNVKAAGQTHVGLEIPPAFLLHAPELGAPPVEAQPALAAPNAAAAVAGDGDTPPMAGAPPMKRANSDDPPPLTTKDLEKDAEMRKKEGGFNEVGEAKTTPDLPTKKKP
jgi:hypothetical protein